MPKCTGGHEKLIKDVAKWDNGFLCSIEKNQRQFHSNPGASAAQRRYNMIVRREARKRGLL